MDEKLSVLWEFLEHDVVPLPHLLREVLRLGQEAMRRPVEIEFAVEIDATTRSLCVLSATNPPDGRCEKRCPYQSF